MNWYNQVPHPTRDTIWESVKNTRKQESQQVSPLLAGDHKVVRNRQDSVTDKHETQITKRIHKRSSALEQSVRKILEGLNMFEYQPTLISDLDQDK